MSTCTHIDIKALYILLVLYILYLSWIMLSLVLWCSYYQCLSMICYRSYHWWHQIVLRTFTDRDWIENFRMSHETFTYLCQQLSTALRRQDTTMRKAISVEQRLAVTLWCLATPCEYRTIAHLFGIARSTVCEIVQETRTIIVQILLQKYIQFPSGNRLDELIDGFLTKWGVS